MTALIVLLVVLPVALVALVTKHFGFKALHTLIASVCGELLGLLLLEEYNRWAGAKLIVGESPQIVTQIAVYDAQLLGTMLLIACTLGLIIGLCVLFLHWAYGLVHAA